MQRFKIATTGGRDLLRNKWAEFKSLQLTVKLLAVREGLESFAQNMYCSFLPIFFSSVLKMNPQQIGLIGSVRTLVHGFTQAPAGWLGDLFGKKKLLIAGTLLYV